MLHHFRPLREPAAGRAHHKQAPRAQGAGTWPAHGGCGTVAGAWGSHLAGPRFLPPWLPFQNVTHKHWGPAAKPAAAHVRSATPPVNPFPPILKTPPAQSELAWQHTPVQTQFTFSHVYTEAPGGAGHQRLPLLLQLHVLAQERHIRCVIGG